MVTRLESLDPIEKYNFPWGSNRHSADLREKERYGAYILVRHLAHANNM